MGAIKEWNRRRRREKDEKKRGEKVDITKESLDDALETLERLSPMLKRIRKLI
jgi:hypothetical protein